MLHEVAADDGSKNHEYADDYEHMDSVLPPAFAGSSRQECRAPKILFDWNGCFWSVRWGALSNQLSAITLLAEASTGFRCKLLAEKSC